MKQAAAATAATTAVFAPALAVGLTSDTPKASEPPKPENPVTRVVDQAPRSIFEDLERGGFKARPKSTEKTSDTVRQTRALTNKDIRLAPKRSSAKEKYEHYKSLVLGFGGKMNPKGRATILALRGLDLEGQRHESVISTKLNDVLVVLKEDGTFREFPGSTRSSQPRAPLSMSRDGNGDGVADPGQIHPGVYDALLVTNNYHGRGPAYHLTQDGNGFLSGVRDLNHDRRFSPSEYKYARKHGLKMSEILIHAPMGKTASSTGCLNALNMHLFKKWAGTKAEVVLATTETLPA